MIIELDMEDFLRDTLKIYEKNLDDVKFGEAQAFASGVMVGISAIGMQMTKKQHEWMNEHIDNLLKEVI